MSIKKSLEKLKSAIARKSQDPYGGDICNCCTVMVDGKAFCDCQTAQQGGGMIFGARYDGACTGSGGGPAGSTRKCPCYANQPTIG